MIAQSSPIRKARTITKAARSYKPLDSSLVIAAVIASQVPRNRDWARLASR